MKISKLIFDKNVTSSLGLEELNIERLGNVVALVGKNGSGKTRLLNLIDNHFNQLIVNDCLIGLPKSRMSKNKDGEIHGRQRIEQEEHYNWNGDRELIDIDAKKYYTDKIKLDMVSFQNVVYLNKLTKQIQGTYFYRIRSEDVKQLKEVLQDNDGNSVSFESLIEGVSEGLTYNELGAVYKSSLKYLRKLPNQLIADQIDCIGNVKKFEARVSYKRYLLLKNNFEKLIGKQLMWESKTTSTEYVDDGVTSKHKAYWKIDDREFDYAELSDGEKTLFTYVLLFFLMEQNNGAKIRESVVVIDEPELHLHPDAEIELVEGLRNLIGEKGQLWIATHSLNILSHLNYNEIFVVKNGKVFHPSRTIQKDALSELLKIDHRVKKIGEFVNSISDWTFSHFMIECFTKPEVVEITGGKDPQTKIFKNIINELKIKKKSVLLDFGAGKGRVLRDAFLDQHFFKNIEFYALEPEIECHSFLKEIGAKKVYAESDTLPEGCFDFVLLCNVLHEVKLSSWVEVLNKIKDSLKEDGYLIVIEAKTLSKGEKVGEVGFMLLDDSELKSLFGLEDSPLILNHSELKDLISAFVIPKSQMKTISNEDVLRAVSLVNKNTIRRIQELRADDDNSNCNKRGRQAAFLSQLHVNSELAIESLTNPNHI